MRLGSTKQKDFLLSHLASFKEKRCADSCNYARWKKVHQKYTVKLRKTAFIWGLPVNDKRAIWVVKFKWFFVVMRIDSWFFARFMRFCPCWGHTNPIHQIWWIGQQRFGRCYAARACCFDAVILSAILTALLVKIPKNIQQVSVTWLRAGIFCKK